MKTFLVHIRNNETMEFRTYTDDDTFDDEFNIWAWTDGNFGCDCNRELFFERLGGKEYEEISTSCSEGRFSIFVEDSDTNEIIYDEF